MSKEYDKDRLDHVLENYKSSQMRATALSAEDILNELKGISKEKVEPANSKNPIDESLKVDEITKAIDENIEQKSAKNITYDEVVKLETEGEVTNLDVKSTKTIDRTEIDEFYNQVEVEELKNSSFSRILAEKQQLNQHSDCDEFEESFEEEELLEIKINKEDADETEQEWAQDETEQTESDNYDEIKELADKDVKGFKLKFILASVVCVLLSYVTLASRFSFPLPEVMNKVINPETFIVVSMGLFVVSVLIAIKELAFGLRELLTMHADETSLLSFATIVVLVQGGFAVANATAGKDIIFNGAIISFLIAARLYTKIIASDDISKNLGILKKYGTNISLDMLKTKEAIDALEPVISDEGQYSIFGIKKIKSTRNFEEMAYDFNEETNLCSIVAPIAIACAVLLAGSFTVLKENSGGFVNLLAAFSCGITPIIFGLSYAIPFKNLTERLRQQGNVVVGAAAVDLADDCNGLAIEDGYIFERGTIKLKSMKIFNNVRIDEIFVDVASVLTHLKCALATVFMEIIQNDESLLRDVEECVVEKGNGIVASFSGNRTIIIGKKSFMKKNGCEVPDVFNAKGDEISGNSNLLYVGSDDGVHTVFQITYDAQNEIKTLLSILNANNVKVYFKSRDILLKNDFLIENFALGQDKFTMLSEYQIEKEEKELGQSSESESGIYIANDTLENIADVICECKRMKEIVARNLIISVVALICTPLFIAALIALYGVDFVGPISLIPFLLLWLVPLMINSQK